MVATSPKVVVSEVSVRFEARGKLAVDPSPLVVALVLGPMMEKTLRQSLFLGRGSVLELVSRPLTASLLLLGALALIGPPLVRMLRRPQASPSRAPRASASPAARSAGSRHRKM